MKARDFAGGVVVKLVLDRLGGRPAAARAAGRRRSSRRPHPTTESSATPWLGPSKGPLLALMIASACIAVPLMIIFEHPITRIVGVIGLLAFIISGVFVIANPAFLEAEEGR